MTKQHTALSLLAATFLSTAAALCAEEEPPEITHDGLHRVPGSEAAAAWVKPEADFSSYDKVVILEAGVAFRKNWLADHNRSTIYRISKRDVERMKEGMSKLFRQTFVEVLSGKGGYPVVDEAESDVLLLRPSIIDLDVAAPDVGGSGGSYVFTTSAGAATLLLELYDSVSGEILARAVDRQVASSAGDLMRWSTRAANRGEARKIIAGWARLLRQRLDEIHAKKEP